MHITSEPRQLAREQSPQQLFVRMEDTRFLV